MYYTTWIWPFASWHAVQRLEIPGTFDGRSSGSYYTIGFQVMSYHDNWS